MYEPEERVETGKLSKKSERRRTCGNIAKNERCDYVQNDKKLHKKFFDMRNIHNLYIDLNSYGMYNRFKDTVNLNKLALFIFLYL